MIFLVKGDLYGFERADYRYRRNAFVFRFCRLGSIFFSSKEANERSGIICRDETDTEVRASRILTLRREKASLPEFNLTIKPLESRAAIFEKEYLQ
jgi:hypothetical protein